MVLPFKIKCTIKHDILHVEAAGVREMDSVTALARKVLDLAHRRKMTKILVDVRELSGRLGMSDAVHLVTKIFPEIKKARIIKQAAIVDVGVYKRQYRFFETLARNRGYNLMLFDDVEAAFRWIEGES